MTGVARAAVALRDAEARRDSVVDAAAAVWTDAAFRSLRDRVLTPLTMTGSRFTRALELAETELAQAQRLLTES